MRILMMTTAALAMTLSAQAASAQDVESTNGTSFRGVRLEANLGGDRFRSQGESNDKFGYGGTIGFDGTINNKIVIGPEASFWRANNWNENCTAGNAGGTVCHKSFEEWGVGVRAGFLVSPNFLIFGKGGYVANEQRKRFDAPAGQTSFRDRVTTTGYQYGGGVEYTLSGPEAKAPIFVGAQYVYSQYNDNTSRQRVMGTIGIRFK